nr:hypothetical protein CFP56_55963 [Quercus suber]
MHITRPQYRGMQANGRPVNKRHHEEVSDQTPAKDTALEQRMIPDLLQGSIRLNSVLLWRPHGKPYRTHR